MSAPNLQRVPIVCAMLAATYWFFEPLVQGYAVKGFATDLVIVLVAIVTLIAIGQLLYVQVRRLAGAQRYDALTILGAFTVTTIVGVGFGPASKAFVWIFDYVYASARGVVACARCFCVGERCAQAHAGSFR